MSAIEHPWHGVVTQLQGIPRMDEDDCDMVIMYVLLDDQNSNVGKQRQGQIGVAIPAADAPLPFTKIDVHLVVNKGDIDAELSDLPGA